MVSVVLSYNGIGHCFHCGACPVYQEKSAGMVSLLWVFRFYVCRDSHRLLRISTDWDILGGKHERLVGACHHTRDVICGCCLAVFYPSDTLLIFRFRARQVVGFNSRSHCGCHRHRHSLLYAYSGEISENSLCGYFFLHNSICPKMGYR